MSANIPDLIVEFNDHPPDSPSSSWTDVSTYARRVKTYRGRQYDEDAFQPGSVEIDLDNSDSRFDPTDATGPYYGKLGVNYPWRVSFPGTYIGFGYCDGFSRSWPGGMAFSLTTVRATDRFKLLNKSTFGPLGRMATSPGEGTDVRIRAILTEAGFPVTYISDINSASYTARNVEQTIYPAKSNALTEIQEINKAEGGVLYMNGQGILVYKVADARTSDTRSNTSQATYQFGTANVTGAFDVNMDLTLIYDDELYTNYVTVTDFAGVDHHWPATMPSVVVGFDLGDTRLYGTDAGFRARDLYTRRFTPQTRSESVTLDCGSSTAYRAEALAREISDRITLVVGPRGGGATYTQDYFIESISHDIDLDAGQWLCSFGLNPVPPP